LLAPLRLDQHSATPPPVVDCALLTACVTRVADTWTIAQVSEWLKRLHSRFGAQVIADTVDIFHAFEISGTQLQTLTEEDLADMHVAPRSLRSYLLRLICDLQGAHATSGDGSKARLARSSATKSSPTKSSHFMALDSRGVKGRRVKGRRVEGGVAVDAPIPPASPTASKMVLGADGARDRAGRQVVVPSHQLPAQVGLARQSSGSEKMLSIRLMGRSLHDRSCLSDTLLISLVSDTLLICLTLWICLPLLICLTLWISLVSFPHTLVICLVTLLQTLVICLRLF